MNLGYCVTLGYLEQGDRGLRVTVTHQDPDRAKELVESVSGYPEDHPRYKQEIFDLTEIYHLEALGMDSVYNKLKDLSPESAEAIRGCQPVEYSVQAYEPFMKRERINRNWERVNAYLHDYYTELVEKAKEKGGK